MHAHVDKSRLVTVEVEVHPGTVLGDRLQVIAEIAETGAEPIAGIGAA